MGKTTDALNRVDDDGFDLGEVDREETFVRTGANPYTAGNLGTGIGTASPDTWTTETVDRTRFETGESDGDQEIEATRTQIERTRSEMSETIDAIQDRLSPGNIAQGAKDAVRDATVGKAQEMASNVANSATDMVSNAGETARDFGGGLWETIRQNPVPAALAGLGIGWLLMSGRKGDSQSRTYPRGYQPGTYGYRGAEYRPEVYAPPSKYAGYEPYGGYSPQGHNTDNSGPGITDRMGAAASQAQDAAGQVAGQAQDLAGQAVQGAQQMAGQVQDSAGQMVQSAQYGVQQAQTGFSQLVTSNPLAVAAGAVALGIAVGLTIPETDKENELMGPTHDSLMDQAQQTVQEKVQQVQGVAQQAVGAAKDAAQQAASDKGLTS